MILDHVSIPVPDLERAARFYDSVLAPLGYRRRLERPGAVGYGTQERASPGFWILEESGRGASSGPGLHLSFHARSRAEVDAFYAAALRCGGRDAGAPGARPQYTSGFYGAFAIDLDGYKIEATFREAP